MQAQKVFQQNLWKDTAEKTTITCGADTAGSLAGKSIKFFGFNRYGAVKNFYVWFRVSGTGTDPAYATYTGIVVDIATNATANTVQAAALAAINAATFNPLYNPSAYMVQASGSAPSLVLTNVYANVAGQATVDGSPATGWTIVRTTTGTVYAATDNNLGASASGVSYSWKPDATEVIYLREIIIEAWIATLVDGSKWGTSASALTNGFVIEIVSKDGNTQVLPLTPKIYNNSQLCQLGFGSLSTIGLNIVYNLGDAFGGDVPINGGAGEYIRILTADSWAGLTLIYVHLRGHHKDYT